MLVAVRRSRPEWLLAPLFVLPLAAVAAFCLYVRADYRTEIAAARAGGAEFTFEHEGAVGKFADLVVDETRPGAMAEDVAVDWNGMPVRVRMSPGQHPEGAPRFPHRWVFCSDFPAALSPDAVANARVRLDIERGVPPARLEALGQRARLFRDLYAKPNLARLAAAPFPAETKRFLAGRTPGGAAAMPLLDALLAHAPAPPNKPGAHGAWLRVKDRPLLLWPDHPTVHMTWTETERGRVRLHYSSTLTVGLAPWRGGPKPLAGYWTLDAVHGERWWDDALFRRWMGPVLLAAVALLLFPAFAWTAMRRQRSLDAMRVRFLTEIAHDLRTPLTALRLQAELFQRDVPDKSRADRIAGEAAKLSHLLGNLLDLTRLERGARRYEIEELDIGELIEEAARDFRAAHAERANDLALTNELALSSAPVRARGDRTALRRCLANLLDNAGKHTAVGTPVRVAWETSGGRVRIDVADDGRGVDPADRARLFERHHRGARARHDAVPGTGLGLALVRELARGMGGDVRLMPVARGACFRVELPGA